MDGTRLRPSFLVLQNNTLLHFDTAFSGLREAVTTSRRQPNNDFEKIFAARFERRGRAGAKEQRRGLRDRREFEFAGFGPVDPVILLEAIV
jgi:hypothetical protein